MSPDSALGQLAQRVARLEQRVDDLTTRAVERLSELADAVREARSESTKDYERFGPMMIDHSDMRADMRHLAVDVAKIAEALEHLEQRFEQEKRERIQGQQARREELEEARAERQAEFARLEIKRQEDLKAQEKLNREMSDRDEQRKLENRRLFYGIAAVFLSSLATVLAQILGGAPS